MITVVLSAIVFVLSIAILITVNRFRFIIVQAVPQWILGLFRCLYSYPSLLSFPIPIAVVGIVFFNTDVELSVVVTLFYASVLFVGYIIQTDRPYPSHTGETIYFDRDYGDSDGPGFAYEFNIRNHGEKTLFDPIIEYKLYDTNLESITEWKSIPRLQSEAIEIDARGGSATFTIESDEWTDGGNSGIFIAVRVLPRLGDRVLGDWWVENIAD
jgi:hypothetical protein